MPSSVPSFIAVAPSASFLGGAENSVGGRIRRVRTATFSASRAPARIYCVKDVKDVSETPSVDKAAEVKEGEVAYQVPGKIQLSEQELIEQKAALDKFTLQLRKKQMQEEREAARLFGWVPYAETLNGRLAMFFIATGVLTEYWTGYTLPQQVELMLRTLGFF